MIYNKDNIFDILESENRNLATNLHSVCCELLASMNKEITTSLILGDSFEEKDYILKDLLVVKNHIGYSLFLKLYDEKNDSVVTFEIPNIIEVNANLINPDTVKTYFKCYNSFLDNELYTYKFKDNSFDFNTLPNFEKIRLQRGQEYVQDIRKRLYTTHRIFY